MSEDGGEDSPPRPKRKIKKVMVLPSDSSSDSDESVAASGLRRKRLRVVSDDGSDSSGSSVCVRRTRGLPQLRDSADSDSSASDVDRAAPAPASTKPSGFATDSSEGNSDKCSICLLRFTNQEVGTPQNCEHIFCLDCITEWSKNVNTCPVDRMTFDSIIVRTCAGGRVLRTEPVKVIERAPSVEMLVIEDPTVCEVCGRTDNEETMLLCDNCDLGYHMQCLTPPLHEVPIEQWFCPDCALLFSNILNITNLVRGAESTRNSVGESVTSERRVGRAADQPSTSGTRRARAPPAPSSSTRRAATSRRRTKRRRTKTVIIEYEVRENGKFPVTKTVKRKLKRRKTKRRQPRTAARRAHVRASVRARLADVVRERRAAAALLHGAAEAVQSLSLRRVPALSLFGAAHALDYFSDDEAAGSEAASTGSTAVAARPTSSILSAYGQARRKMICIPSPPSASSAPDLLSSILESQTLLHSKRSIVSIAVDGTVDVKLESRAGERRPDDKKKRDRVDLSSGEAAAKKAPSYPGQSRGGWGGGYRGNYHREQGSTGNFRSGGYENNYGAGGFQNRQGNGVPYRSHDDGRHDEVDPFGAYQRRPQYPPGDDAVFDRNRRPPPGDRGRPSLPAQPDQGGYAAGSGYRPFPPGRAEGGPAARRSFGGFDNPLDMRTGRAPEGAAPYRPLPEPPVFPLDERRDKSEDERSDPDLVIDTEKYDPTEPTADEPEDAGAALRLCPGVLAGAVRQVLHDHRGLLAAPRAASDDDDDDDGDCPNFSIYSAASVHIANNSSESPAPPAAPLPPPDDMRDLVQEDDDEPPPPDEPAPLAPPPAPPLDLAKNKLEEELKEKVSKRCPITTDPRHPIKIKLNAPSLMKRQVSLYDEDETRAEAARELTPDATPPPSPPPTPGAAPTPPPSPPATLEEKEPDPVDKSRSVTPEHVNNDSEEKPPGTPTVEDSPRTPSDVDEAESEAQAEAPSPARASPAPTASPAPAGSPAPTASPAARASPARAASPADPDDEALEKMTESISETEDERSYTPCLDENKEDSLPDAERDKGIEGLDTEMISEDEDMFAVEERARDDPPRQDEPKKKKKKEGKKEKEGKEKTKSKTKKADKSEVTFKKLSKSGKERKYRSGSAGSLGGSSAGGARDGARRRRRQDLQRYDVRSVLGERRRRRKDAFGRDVSQPRSDASPDPAPLSRLSISPKLRRSGSPLRRRSISPIKRRSISPIRRRSISPVRKSSISPMRRRSISPIRRRSISPIRRRSISPIRRRSISPFKRRSISPGRRRSVSPARRRSKSPLRRRSKSPVRRRSKSPPARRRSVSPVRARVSPAHSGSRPSPARARRRRRSGERDKRAEPRARRRRSADRPKKRRRSASGSPRPKPSKKKKRVRPSRSPSRRRRSPRRRRARRRSASPAAPALLEERPLGVDASPGSVDSRLLSPRTPPPEPSPPPSEPRRRRSAGRHRRARSAAGPSKEVFTSGDNILVSVSFKEQERAPAEERRVARRARRRRRRRQAAQEGEAQAPRPVAIIDLERSPFRELTPSPRPVIVLSDSEGAGEGGPQTPPAPPAPPAPAPASPDAYDPYEPTRSASASPAPPPEPRACMTLETAQKTNLSADEVIDRRPFSPIEKVMALLQSTRDVPPDPPPGDAATGGPPEPLERSPTPPPASAAPLVPPVLAVPATVAVSMPAPAPAAAPAVAPAPPIRIVLPSPTRTQAPKLFLAKPSPIKSDPIKPMQAQKPPKPPPALVAGRRRDGSSDGDSPYSPGSSDFGDLFSPPPGSRRDTFDALVDRPRRKSRSQAAKVPVKFNRKKGKTQVGVKLDDDNLKILDELPSSAVEMQVKSKFLKKLNRQERVVEEVKLVLKPHYNKKHVTKDEYKDILRRTVPKICHNKTGEINPTKIQALVEAYVKKFRKKHKLGLA